MGIRIIAKSDGLDLYSHSEAVKDTAFIFNEKGNFLLDKRIIFYMTIFHDLGKANPLFQENMKNNNFQRICRHEISSILFINGVPEDIRDIVALSILSHHKTIRGSERSIYDLWDKNTDALYSNHINNIEEWGNIVKKYLKYHYDISITIPSVEKCKEIIDYYCEIIENLESGYSLYRGLLMMADHFASCYYNNEERLDNIEKLFEIPDLKYYNSKDERYPLSLIDSDSNKKHTFVISPTGCGKTNFMLKRCKGRVFYLLPYQASINAMYNRILKDLNHSCEIGLKHAALKSLIFMDDNIKTLSTFQGLPIKVMTPFQLMPINFCLKGYESIILDVMGQDVIFDEPHTYKGLSHNCIVNLIKALVSLNCRIHLCTATMPTILIKKIIDILGEEDTQIVKLSDETLDTFDRHIIHTVEDIDYDKIIDRYNNGEKVLIVRNQIKLAQETYKNILSRVKDSKHLLLHSKFRRMDRNEKEDRLINDFNKSSEPCIVVSTQVVEVSLDINFDVMFTDCSEIMSLIQRFGRINRQRKNIGIYKDIYIFSPNELSFPYDKADCDKTYEALKVNNDNVLHEKNIQSLIDYVHDKDDNGIEEQTSPFNDNDEWKYNYFSNNVNTNISKELKMNGTTFILDSDYDDYVKTNDSKYEIPISFVPKNINDIAIKAVKVKENDDSDNRILFYVIPSSSYSKEFGFINN